jgi:hypothetical protein
MIRRLRDIFGGGTSRDSVDATVSRGIADVLAALDNVIDDDAALGRLYADLGASAPGAAPGWDGRTAADQARIRIGRPGSATTTARTSRHAAPQRRLVLRSAVGVAAALTAGAVALVAAGVTGARHNGTELTAYVVKRVDSALSGAGQGQIAYMTVTTKVLMLDGTTATATAEEWSYGDRWRSAVNSPDGHPVYDEGSSAAAVYTLVSYPSRTWARQSGLGHPATQGCATVVAALPSLLQPGLPVSDPSAWLPTTAAGALRAAISCGTLETDGQQVVDGVDAIKLTSRPDSPLSETIWVSPGTYLPVRVVIRSASGQPFPWQTADISWLQPSEQNQAKLTVPIPAGFHQGPLAKGVSAISQQTQFPAGQSLGNTRPG